MRAVRVRGPEQIELATVPEPTAGPDFLVKVDLVGICGTDTKIYSGKIPVDYPRIMGHELIGRVIDGPSSSPHPPGSRVLVDPGVACGWCDLCQSGRPHLCRNGGLLGRDADGAFTEYIRVPLNRLVSVPESISSPASGLLQVLGTCVHAIKRLRPVPGQVAAVIGLGVAGQLITQLLAVQGLSVVGITRSEWKRDLASSSGAVATASPDEAASTLEELTEGRGPAIVVEAVGTEATLASAIELVGIGGEVLAYGTLTGSGEGLPYYQLYHKELTIYNPRAAIPGDYADGIVLAAAGALELEPIVTHHLDLTEAELAFRLVHDSSSLKVLMTVS